MLWCSACHYAHYKALWEVGGFKYGVCPKCGVSAYRNAFPWLEMANVHGWLLEINGVKYEPDTLF